MIYHSKSGSVGQRLLTLTVLAAAITLAGCGTLRKIAGSDKNPPDEFKVVNKPPLILPPDYNLRPPRPGEPTAQDLQPSVRLDQALPQGRTTLPPPASPGEQALLRILASGGKASPNVRTTVGDETIIVEKGTLLNDILSTGERVGGPDGSNVDRIRSEPLPESGSD